MADITCARCGNTAPGLDRAPLPGRNGELVLAQTCGACWREWLAMQIKFINEYRLSSTSQEHFDFLMAQMKTFLNLQEE
jgi:Fe-S cluster biosynthesis and repair protein YggX